MENASKALIIAGAILLSILIIGIGIFVYNGAAENVKSGVKSMSKQEVQQYNEPFTTYGGENVSGSQAASLCEEIRTHNLSNQSDMSRQINVVWDGEATAEKAAYAGDTALTSTATSAKGKIRSGYTYKVTFGFDPKTGLVTEVGIKKN